MWMWTEIIRTSGVERRERRSTTSRAAGSRWDTSWRDCSSDRRREENGRSRDLLAHSFSQADSPTDRVRRSAHQPRVDSRFCSWPGNKVVSSRWEGQCRRPTGRWRARPSRRTRVRMRRRLEQAVDTRRL